MDIIKQPHITEKTQEDKYVFRVAKNANKIKIKKAIEKKYKVNIIKVNIINIPKKKRRVGRIEGFKKGYKKAIITVKHGQKIDTTKEEKSRPKSR